MLRRKQLYRMAIRDDREGSVLYRRGSLGVISKWLEKQFDSGLFNTEGRKIFIVPAEHKMPWEVPEDAKDI